MAMLVYQRVDILLTLLIYLEVQDQTKWLVFRMMHVKDSLLPTGKVRSFNFLGINEPFRKK